MQFKRSYMRNDKMLMKGSLKLLAHLVNQQVVGSVLALQVAVTLLEKPTGESLARSNRGLTQPSVGACSIEACVVGPLGNGRGMQSRERRGFRGCGISRESIARGTISHSKSGYVNLNEHVCLLF